MAEIGDTLREARMKARIDVSELEAKTKIRAKYLRALENEEWSLLPGPTFVKSFLRTYAQALGLDGRALVEEYRLHHERPSEAAPEAPVARPGGGRASRIRVPGPRPGGPAGPSRGYMIAVGAVTLVIVVLIVALLTGGGSSSKSPSAARTAKRHVHAHHHRAPGTSPATPPAPSVVALSLHATARVYVCLIGEGGRKLLPGTILRPGASTPTFHARHFLITLGNSGVRMFVDGRPRAVPESGQAIGYSITKAGRRPLAAGQLPTCT
jgi:cytoskeleton protein RodZ